MAWWSSGEVVGDDSERLRGGGDISGRLMVGAALSATARLGRERRERDVEEAEEGEADGDGEGEREVVVAWEAAEGRISGEVFSFGGDGGECEGEKAPCSMGRPVERSEMAVGERMVGEEG